MIPEIYLYGSGAPPFQGTAADAIPHGVSCLAGGTG